MAKRRFEFIAQATPQESIQENKAIKQKARSELFGMFKGDPDVNQKKLKELVAKEFDLTATERGDLFTIDPQQQQQIAAAQAAAPGGQTGGAPGQPGAQIPGNPENPALSANGQQTAANIPRKI